MRQMAEKSRSKLELSEILRTTSKKQAFGGFRVLDGYCAIAVIMAEKFGWNGELPNGLNHSLDGFREWLNNERNKEIADRIVDMNDEEKKTFSEISDWLKEHKL